MKLFNDLFVNLCIVCMVFFSLNLLMRKRIGFISPETSTARRLQFGVCMGLVGILLMHHTIRVDGTIVDLRQIPVVVAAIYGGVWTPIVAAVLIALGRVALFGVSQATELAVTLILLVGLSTGLLSKMKVGTAQKWMMMNAVNLLLTFVVFFLVVDNTDLLMQIYLGYGTVYVTGGIIIYGTMEYLRSSKLNAKRYRSLVELSPLAIIMHKDGKVIYANPAGIEAMGAGSAEDILGSFPLDWVHPADRALAAERMENTLQNGSTASGEYRILCLDGRVVDVAATSIYDAETASIQLVMENITARKQAERALSESEQLNRRLIELSPQPIAFHWDYRYKFLNPAGMALFGAAHENDMLDVSIFDSIHLDDRGKAAVRLSGVYEQNSVPETAELKIVRLDGGIIDAEVIATPIPYQGKNAGLTLFRDITEEKKAEAEREQAERTIRDSAELHFRLQTSLDRFSSDLFGVVQVAEMERLFVKEVRDLIGVSNVSLVEVNCGNEQMVKSGSQDIPDTMLKEISALDIRGIPVCEIWETADGCFIKIVEIRGTSHLLCIGETSEALENEPYRVWLKTIARYVSILYDNFRVIQDLTLDLEQMGAYQIAPAWLVRLLFSLSENERNHMAQDLHDAALQEQIIWYRKLDQLSGDQMLPEELREQLAAITQGLLKVVSQIRITCNELRPSMLKEGGLITSLETLLELTQLRAEYRIRFDASNFRHRLDDDLSIGIYRIVQDLLANAAKHSKATRVSISLSSFADRIQLVYEDNGTGMNVSKVQASFDSMGVYGMKERVRSMEGQIEFRSAPDKGFFIYVTLPAPLDQPA